MNAEGGSQNEGLESVREKHMVEINGKELSEAEA